MGHTPTPLIPGIVDGLFRTTLLPDGTVSLHILVGSIDSRVYDQIELVLSAEHARVLARELMGNRPPPSDANNALPCSVGLRRAVRQD